MCVHKKAGKGKARGGKVRDMIQVKSLESVSPI